MDGDFRRRIQQLGLTEKETETYLTILESGPTKVTEIAAEVDVSKRYIYTIAKKLEDRHLVIVNDYFTPTTIEAAPGRSARLPQAPGDRGLQHDQDEVPEQDRLKRYEGPEIAVDSHQQDRGTGSILPRTKQPSPYRRSSYQS